MTAVAKRSGPYLLVAIISAWIATQTANAGDWQGDSWPAIHALIGGHLGTYLSAEAMMGPFATLIEAPSVALSGATRDGAFAWAAFPCVVSVGVLGLYLGRVAARRGATLVGQILIPAVCLLNPLTFEALRGGHPEELLTAALAIGAVATAAEGHERRTAVLLGLAVASKQWAVIAALPVLMALPTWRPRVRVGAGAAMVAVVLYLPALLAAPHAFFDVQGNAAATGGVVGPWSVWWPLAEAKMAVYHVGGETLVGQVRHPPSAVGALSHPLIVLLAVGLPMALAMRRRRFTVGAADAMALVALIALIRCAFDPVDNAYYHAPLLLALFGWDVFASRGLTLRGLLGAAVAFVVVGLSRNGTEPSLLNSAYLAAVLAAGFAITSSLFGPVGWTRVRQSGVLASLSPNSGD